MAVAVVQGYEIQVTCFNCTELQSHNWSRFKLAAELVALDSKVRLARWLVGWLAWLAG